MSHSKADQWCDQMDMIDKAYEFHDGEKELFRKILKAMSEHGEQKIRFENPSENTKGEIIVITERFSVL